MVNSNNKKRRATWSKKVKAAQDKARSTANWDCQFWNRGKAAWIRVYQIERRRLCWRLDL